MFGRFKKKKEEAPVDELSGRKISYSNNLMPPFDLEGEVIREDMLSIYIKDKDGNTVIRNVGQYQLK